MKTSTPSARNDNAPTVMIVEDDPLIAMTVEDAVESAGFDVCAVVGSEKEAIAKGAVAKPDLAVVDVRLAPGDGKVVAKTLSAEHDTGVLMATGDDLSALNHIGAVAALAKPYAAEEVPPALEAVEAIKNGEDPGELPEHLVRLKA